MFIRMTTIINNLDALDRTYTNVDIVGKILRSLPKT
ncbi:UBN2 domain-containing protein [Populus alba x Populus x berolinensis]|uniref:UBN2 domain-containing protein n=1 Tax=Populus alba x Populus x berolinensis TaxID=444605 RepID=A0AAD6W0D1_9ROSI|nr:UBN2 domain-containing protein [Populus alba x Populus x berolinensis]